MLTFGTPAFLLAGALAALVPLALHLIRRRPPARAPLPTERFLTPDPRTSVRVSRPTDPLLLALRMLLLALAGAAFARPAWVPRARGTSEIVLLDRGAAMASGWARAVANARGRLLGADGQARGELVLFDTAALRVPRRHVTPALFDSLASAPPSAGTIRYAAALRAIPGAARELRGADSVRVAMITRPRWGGWSEGLAPLRRAAWRGTIELVALPDAPAADSGGRRPAADARRAVILAPEGRRLEYPVAALRATGWDVEILPRDQPLRGTPRLLVIGGSMTIFRDGPEFAAVRAGATILFDGRVGARIQGEPMWDGFLAADSIAGTLRFADGPRLAGAAGRAVRPVPGKATVLAAWDDGEPAAVAWREGRGCVVYLATQVDAGEMVLDPAYPRVLDRLAHGCSSPDGHGGDDTPLDAGARAVLAGGGARTVAAGAARAGGGVALGRWMMAAALLVALAETFLAYGRKKPA